jgi:hypothetical protein
MSNKLTYAGMCLVEVPNPNKEEGCSMIDIGSYYKRPNEEIVVVCTEEKARKYHKYINVPILVKKHGLN